LKKTNCGPARVAAVRAGSPAEDAGVRAGDRIWKIDGEPMRDAIDYLLALAGGGSHALDVERGGETLSIVLDTDSGPLGIELEDQVFGALATCDNNCMFCFVDQLPTGLRQSVYIKDDDFRLSFLAGNFITLTNLTHKDVRRIARERLSPLYVSLHSTEEVVRKKMFGNPEAARSLKVLRELLRDGIEVHAQVVLVRGVNDASHLDKTLADVGEHFNGIATVGVVPVGLTRGGRRTLPSKYGFDAASSADLISQVERWRSELGGRVAAADEFFFMAGLQPPEEEYYGEFEQLENGIGLARLFRTSFLEAVEPGTLDAGNHDGVAIVTSPIGAWALGPLGIEEAGATVLQCENTLFGANVNVCGLLPGRDVASALEKTPGARVALVPGVAIDATGAFIDGMTTAEVVEKTGVRLEVVPATGEEMAAALRSAGRERSNR